MTKTHVFLITDMSGSMSTLAEDVRGGFNTYLATLSADPDHDQYRLTVCLFDDRFIDLCKDAPLSEVPRLTTNNYQPRGMTALMDAVGMTVNSAPPLQDEDKALVVIQTDGMENASKEYTKEKISALITELEATGKWSFIFLGAGYDAWRQAAGMGVNTANTIRTQNTSKGTQASYTGLATATRSYSKGATGSQAAAEVAREVA